LGHSRVLLLCLGGAFLSYAPQAFVHTPVQLLLLRMLSAAFLGGTSPSVNALVAARTPRDQRGTIFGLSSSISSSGAALGPMIGAFIAATWGYPWVFLATSAALVGVGAWASTTLRGPAKEKRA
jgi:MFS transporter, DHA1 family, multidrug resistance protein